MPDSGPGSDAIRAHRSAVTDRLFATVGASAA
jgi:hypothetical protein